MQENRARNGRTDFIEYVIRRVANGEHITFKNDLEMGFTISGPGINVGRIGFVKWSPWDARANSPWGDMKVIAKPTREMEWIVETETKVRAEVEISYQSHLNVVISNTSIGRIHLRMKNRTWLRKRVYRHQRPNERVEIVTESTTFSYDEKNKFWRVRFFENSISTIPLVLPALAVFLCHYKLFRGYLREKGRLQRIFMHDGMF